MILRLFVLLSVIALVQSCSTDPVPIEYGKDQCVFCDMNIVDKAHSAQHVSDKGKQYKYDAVECLIRYVVRNDVQDIEHILVANYANPGEMIDANNALYIISENIKSPMGANLSAVGSESSAEQIIKENGGEIFTWPAIKNEIEGQKE